MAAGLALGAGALVVVAGAELAVLGAGVGQQGVGGPELGSHDRALGFLLGHVPDQAAELGAEERPGAADGGGGLAEGSADAGVLVTLLFEHPAAELSDGDLAPLRGHSTVTVPGCSTLHQWRQRVAPMDITVDAGTVAERAPRSRNVTSRDGA